LGGFGLGREENAVEHGDRRAKVIRGEVAVHLP
jgi:hypothetical protein